jgi:hypothetical protein
MRKLLTTLLVLLLLASTTFADTFQGHYSIRGSGSSVKNLITRQCVGFFRMVIDRQQIRYITLRKQIGTQAQVADLLAVTARTVQRRERGAMPITREAWLAMEMLSESPLYAPIRHPVNA